MLSVELRAARVLRRVLAVVVRVAVWVRRAMVLVSRAASAAGEIASEGFFGGGELGGERDGG